MTIFRRLQLWLRGKWFVYKAKKSTTPEFREGYRKIIEIIGQEMLKEDKP